MEILKGLRDELKSLGDPGRRASAQRYFREEISLHGVSSADVKRIDRDYFSTVKELEKNYIFSLCEELWRSPYFEENIIACNWADRQSKRFEPDDILIFGRWLGNYVTNWATCDTLCNHAIGNLVMKYPREIEKPRKWTGSDNRWMRRGASVSLIIPARRGQFTNDIFWIAGKLLSDKDDMVQKGYGWMLKATSEANLQMVFDFVMKHRGSMPRTALRYAIEKMPQELKKQAMMKP